MNVCAVYGLLMAHGMDRCGVNPADASVHPPIVESPETRLIAPEHICNRPAMYAVQEECEPSIPQSSQGSS